MKSPLFASSGVFSIRCLSALASTVALALVAGSGCSDGSDGSEFQSPCDTTYAGLCGAACTLDGDCAHGLYCGPGSTCTADCVPGGVECGVGLTCGATGRCSASTGSGEGGGVSGSGTETGVGGGCADVNVTFDQVIPTVVLLIDQSGSMTESFGNGNRWTVVHDALLDPQNGIIKMLENDVRFGLALYTSVQGNQNGGQCPMLTEVSMSLGNYAAIKSVFDAAQPVEDTPTGESITAVANELAPFTEPGPKVIVLATDGEPDTCNVPDPQNGQSESIAAAQAAFGQGIETYVISVGNEVGLPHLQDMANAGVGLTVGGNQNAPFYQALDQQALYDAFETIINGVRPCTFTLDGTVAPGSEGSGTVVLDGESLTYGDPNGWKMNSSNEIELTGTACQKIQDGEHTLDVSFPCGSVTPT
jgi:hypothetical protein